MEKVVAFILLLSLALMLAGCSGNTVKESEEITTAVESVSNTESETETDISTESPTESMTEAEGVTTSLPDTEPTEDTPSENDQILWEVYNSERPFIYSTVNYDYSLVDSNEAMTLQEYMDRIIDEYHPEVDIERYIFIDMDSDGYNELIVMLYFFVEEYLIFHVSGDEVYGYPEVLRGLQGLKVDGTFSGSVSMMDHVYCRTSFEDNVRVDTCFIKDFRNLNVYEINGVECSPEEASEAVDEWNSREYAEWVVLFRPDYSKYPEGH